MLEAQAAVESPEYVDGDEEDASVMSGLTSSQRRSRRTRGARKSGLSWG